MFFCANQEKQDALLYQAYFNDVYKDLNSFTRFEKGEFENLQQQHICATYGELEYASVIKLLKYAKVTEQDTFLDLGSGNGKLLMQVYLQTSAKLCLGIEAVSALVEQAQMVKAQCLQDMQYQESAEHQLQFVTGNFLHTDWQNATIVYTCSTCYTPELLNEIGNKINHENSVKQVYSLKPLPTLTRLKLRTVFRVECSWDSALCFMYSI